MLASRRLRIDGHPLDRIRLQKAIFITTQRGSAEWRDLYHFKRAVFDPYSMDLSRDIARLLAQRLLGEHPGFQHVAHLTTFGGEEFADDAWARLADKERDFLQRVRAYVAERSFRHLCIEVHAEYPALFEPFELASA